MAINISIDRLRIPPGISVPPTVSLFVKPYIGGSYVLVDSGINIDANGYVTDSPKPIVSVDAGERYLLLAVNETCGYQYAQSLILYPYCPVGYELTPDASECYYEEVTDATPPAFGEVTIPKIFDSYGSCGSWIYEEGYNINGTGISNLIPLPNYFWRNGTNPVGCIASTDYTGPLNRCGLWSTTTGSDQEIGFSVCIDVPESKIYYVGIACDNYGIINLDGVNIVTQNPAALDAQYGLTGNVSTFVVWHIYPVFITAGSHNLEMIGFNTFGVAAMGCEVYDNTPAEIIAATAYADLNLVFSSKDYIGQPVMLGSGGLGWTCPPDYSLRACSSPFECVRRVTTPVLINQ